MRVALNLSWRQHPTKQQLDGFIPPITSILDKHRMCFAGHCWRESKNSSVTFYSGFYDEVKSRVGRPASIYID